MHKKQIKELLTHRRIYSLSKKEIRSMVALKKVIDITDKKAKRSLFTGVTVDTSGVIFYRNGLIHREDGPAIIAKNGDRFWYFDNQLHRLGGPAELRFIDKYRGWYNHGKLHNKNGPALVFNKGTDKEIREWFINNVRHNNKGPAVEGKNNLYFWEGKEVSEKKYKKCKNRLPDAFEKMKLSEVI